MQIVIDTNVLISAALSPDGVPAKLLAKALTDHHLVFTSATFAELESRLWKPKFDRYINLEERKAVLHDISAAAVWVEVPQNIAGATYSRDADDDMFIHAALAAEAALLITGDQDLLVLAKNLSDSHKLVICKPAYAITLL
ncbi:MAG: putative toxin-antitoxin system toxin component, PIN family [Polaromonas sp.]